MGKHDPALQLKLAIEYVAPGELAENPLNPRVQP
jgi:hypothetical protein